MCTQAVAAASSCPKPPGVCLLDSCEVSIADCDSGGTTPGGTPGGGQPADPHPPITAYVPACEGNSAGGENTICTGATLGCPNPEATRYWIAEQFWDEATQSYGDWVQRPGSVCLLPDDVAAVDPLLALLAAVRADWREFGLPAATVVTSPGGETLVGAVTRFSTTSPTRGKLPPKEVLGYPVTLSFTATRYVWAFGDGATADLPASALSQQVEHDYRQPGPMTVSLRTFYSATFTAAGTDLIDEPLPGEAEVPGLPVQLLSREARTQLEAGPSQ